MKRILSRLTSLLLILCLLCPAALAETADPPAADVNARYLFIRDGAIHALSYDRIMYRRAGDGWQSLGSLYSDIWAVDSDGERVWLLARQEDESGAWYELCQAAFDGQGALSGVEAPLTISWDVNGENWPPCYGLVVQDDAAYVLMTSDDWSTRNLYRIDMTSGKGTLLLDGHLSALQRYRDGLLLAERSDENARDGRPQAVTIDPAAKDMTVIGSMANGCSGLVYDPETDAIYFSDTSYVYRLNGDASLPVGYLALNGSNGGSISAVVLEARYCFSSYNGWCASPLDPALLPKRSLKLSSLDSGEADLALEFARSHPDVAVEYMDHFYDGLEEFTRVMQDKNAPDVFSLCLDESYITLRDRQYLTDLSSSAMLMDTVGRMADNITRDVLVDGKLYAVPYATQVSMYGYFPAGLEKAGLTAQDVPTSYEGLLDFIERWHQDYFEANEGMQLFEYYEDMRSWLFYEIYNAQLRACQKEGALTLDTPAFRRLLSRLDALTPVIYEVAPLNDGEDFYGDSGNALFTDMVNTVVRGYPFDELYGACPMPMSLDNASDPTVNAFLRMLALNPYSENADVAIEFMEYMAEHLPITTKTAMMPGENDPIERLDYDQELQSMRDRLALMETLLIDAPEESRANLEDEINYLQYHIKDCEEHRWAMTAEEVQWYREHVAPYLTFTTVSVYSDNTAQQLQNLCQRYLDGQASADEFISRFEEIVWMRQEERH